MQVPTPTESSHAGGYTPFMIHQKRLDKVSASSSMLSDSSQGASSSAGTGQLCTCSSLAGCSSLQLQEQHLLAAGNSSSNACRTAEDMFVLVLPRGNHEKSATGADKQKPRQSLGGASDQHSASGSKAHHWMRQVRDTRLVGPKTSSTLHHPGRLGSSMLRDRLHLGQTALPLLMLPCLTSPTQCESHLKPHHCCWHCNPLCLPRSSVARARST